jgi:hypothetical protein
MLPMKKLFVSVLVIGSLVFVAGCQNKSAEEKKVEPKSPTPTEQQTPVAPPPQERVQKGVIEGSLIYPSEKIPENMKICAENMSSKELICTQIHIQNAKYKNGVGYELSVAPGEYQVYAVTPDFSAKDYKAYYSEYVMCGLKADCKSHKILVVKVDPGERESNIDPADWYNVQTPKPAAPKK